jgi:outer membrane protein OmpA-like peptidoglycan-associated protein
VLSENRASSVKQYLVGNGVDESRITSEGHGINDPIADNKTAAGRAKNRRVEMHLRNY